MLLMWCATLMSITKMFVIWRISYLRASQYVYHYKLSYNQALVFFLGIMEALLSRVMFYLLLLN